MSELTLRQQIEAIASQFQIFECILCAAAIQTFLQSQNVAGRQLKLSTGSTEEPFCNIYHEALQENISVNGKHEAIAVEIEGEQLIFDNIHPAGIAMQAWLNNFYSPIKDMGADFQITEIDF